MERTRRFHRDRSPFIARRRYSSRVAAIHSRFRILFGSCNPFSTLDRDWTRHLAKKRAIKTREIIPRQAAGFYAETTLAEV